MRTAAEYNKWTFDFLRRRCDFVANICPEPNPQKIEHHLVWGATVAAVGKNSRASDGSGFLATPDGACFVRGLLNLAPMYGLTTVSIPLLAHDLKGNEARDLLREHPLVVYQRASYYSEHWTSVKDRDLAPALETLRLQAVGSTGWRNSSGKIGTPTFFGRDYRCCAVHGLDSVTKR